MTEDPNSEMTYTFMCRGMNEVVMARDLGDRLLQIMGKEVTTRGIFPASEIRRAMQVLERAVVDERAHPTPIQLDLGRPDKSPEDESPATLQQQVFPLIDLMRRAIAEDRSIIWDT